MKSSEAGQALLVVVLVMVIALTVGLSVVSRSITNLRTSTEEENSQRAFSAAEAGVEQALRTGQNITSPQALTNDSSIQEVKVQSLSGQEFLLNGGAMVPKDDGVDVWLSSYSATDPSQMYLNPYTGNLSIYWGSTTDVCDSSPTVNTMAALEVIVISGSKASPKTTRYGIDPCGVSAGNRISYNRFTQSGTSGGTIAGKTFTYNNTIAITNGLIARIIPVYANTMIGVAGSVALPPQGTIIDSVGVSRTTSRKITYYQGYPELPSEFFPYVLFSPSQ